MDLMEIMYKPTEYRRYELYILFEEDTENYRGECEPGI